MTAVYIALGAVAVLQVAVLAAVGGVIRAVKNQPAPTAPDPPPSVDAIAAAVAAAVLARPLFQRASVFAAITEASEAPRAPINLRPDPTARFNVYRIDEHGLLALNDVQRYSGNSEAFAQQAIEAYHGSEWRGRVYFYEGPQEMKVLD